MFDRFLKESQQVQLYGKLPLAKDYLRVGAGKGSGRALREWLDAAFSSRAARATAPSLPWPARFVLGAVPDEPIMGCAWPSSDQGGERPFPFAVFVERRRKALLQAFGHAFAGLPEIWSGLEDCYARRLEFRDGESFLAGMRGREITIRGAERTPAERIRWESWIGALWPEGPTEGLIALLVSLGRLAVEGGKTPVRLPMVGDLPGLPQVFCWWTVLCALGLVGSSELISLFCPASTIEGDEHAFCTFFRAPLRVDDVAWVSSARGQANLGRGDYCVGTPRFAGESDPAPEGAPSLAESMRGALASARARL
ncbi:MAG: TagF domain-containing protein [Planctomycetota bacterium]